jgi:two-component sensor histidine kinase
VTPLLAVINSPMDSSAASFVSVSRVLRAQRSRVASLARLVGAVVVVTDMVK